MARTRRADYIRSNRIRTLPLSDPEEAARAAHRLLQARDALSRRVRGSELLAVLAAQTGIAVPELVVPDEHQPHRRRGGRIVYSLQGDYRRRAPSPDDPRVARSGKPLGRIRVPNRTPARGDIVRPTAFLNTLLHELGHHYDAEALGLLRSFHTGGFYARLRHLRDQIEAGAGDGLEETAAVRPRRDEGSPLPLLERLWSIIRAL
jgi:hypothetical protein